MISLPGGDFEGLTMRNWRVEVFRDKMLGYGSSPLFVGASRTVAGCFGNVA